MGQRRLGPEALLPRDPRARDLFREVDSRYLEFIRDLPVPVAKLAVQSRTYLGDSTDNHLTGLADLNPVLTLTPWMFWGVTGEAADEEFSDLALGGACISIASILLDHLVDRQAHQPGLVLLFHQLLQAEAQRIYRLHLTGLARAWQEIERLTVDHVRGLAVEAEANRSGTFSSMEDFLAMTSGKVAPIAIGLAAFSAFLGTWESWPEQLRTLRSIAAASQMLDDVGDWRLDAASSHTTYFLNLVRAQSGSPLSDESGLEKTIQDSHLDILMLEQSIRWLDESIEAGCRLRAHGWLCYVRDYRAKTMDHLAVHYGLHLRRVLAGNEHQARTD